MRSDTVKLRSGYSLWTRRVRVWFQGRTPALALLVTLGCASGPSLSKPTANVESLPVTVITGDQPGPTVAFVAGVHGGKVAAVRALEQLRRELPAQLRRGRVLILAPANAAGYRAGLAQISPDDSLNLNRVFPGNATGRPTERLAAAIMRDVVEQSNYVVDMHGSDGDEAVGRFAYAARPGVNPLMDDASLALAMAWGSPVIVRDEEGPRLLSESRFLQTAAHLSNIPAITVFEASSTREDSAATAAFIRGARSVLRSLAMLEPVGNPPYGHQTQLARRIVTTAPTTGHWEPRVAAGAPVGTGELLGRLTSSTGVVQELRALEAGLVLHQRKAGDVVVGTPLIIAGTAAPRSAFLPRP
jgi:predicted deacylase